MENPYRQYMYSYPHKTAYGRLQDVHLKDYLSRLTGRENSLYLHIPFCQYKCGYCNLFSVAGQSERWMRDYVDAMQRQAEQISTALPKGVKFTDLTLGGGTPLILPPSLLRRVFSMARDSFGFESEGHSVVVETSPNQTTEEKLALLKEEGVKRISIGVQSFHEEELAALHRFHKVESVRRALRSIRKMEFECMNIDLIYGIPGQTMDSLKDSLQQALEYEPEELFVYPLYVKPGTFLYQQGLKRSGDTFLMYQCVRDILRDAGYQPHSMRRFVKSSQKLPESLCGFGDTISIGCGGRSYIDELHFCTVYAVKQEDCLTILKEYLETEDFLKITNGFILSPEEQKRRYVIKHILFGRGINQQDYQRHFGRTVLQDFPLIKEWEQEGYVTAGEEYITLTEDGFALSDDLGPQLISSEVSKRTEEFYEKWMI